MIKIEKFENVYGIKKLINCNLIKNNTIIYAPNSVMKTSFADGIDKIQNGEIPVDLFSDEKTKASFTIENNGVKIEENSKKIKLDALIFKQSDFMSVLDNPNIGSLVMSIKLKKQYKDVLDNYESIKQSFNELISKKVLLRRNVDENDIQKVGELYGKTLFTDIIDAIPDLSEYNDAYYKKIEYSELFNDKTESVISTDKFVEKCINYKNYVNKEIDNRVFNSGFDLDSLIEIQKILVSKNYFKAGHKIHLASCEEMDEGALDAYIKKIINDVYGSEEGKRLFTEAKKMLNKNAATRKLASIVESDKRIIEEMSDPKKFKEKILLTKLSDYSDEIDKYKNNVSEYKKQIQSLLKEAEKC